MDLGSAPRNAARHTARRIAQRSRNTFSARFARLATARNSRAPADLHRTRRAETIFGFRRAHVDNRTGEALQVAGAFRGP
jgi:hypothetical protein